MKKLTVMIGLPRSGKSTWVKRNKENAVIVSADQLRLIIYGQKFYSEGEPIVWAVRGYMLRSLMEQGADIVIDETNTTRHSRKPILDLAKKHGYDTTAVWVTTSEDICKLRVSSDDNLLPVIDRMAAQFEEPEILEGFNEIMPIGEE
jgi:predicted kinase